MKSKTLLFIAVCAGLLTLGGCKWGQKTATTTEPAATPADNAAEAVQPQETVNNMKNHMMNNMENHMMIQKKKNGEAVNGNNEKEENGNNLNSEQHYINDK